MLVGVVPVVVVADGLLFCSCVRTLISYTAGNHRHGGERGISALVLIQGLQHTLADVSRAIDYQPVCHGSSLHRIRSELLMYQTLVNSQQVWRALKKLIFSGKYRIFSLL